MKKKYLASVLLILAVTVAAFTNPGKRYFEIAKNLDIFAEVYKEANKYYVDEINPNHLMKEGITTMLLSLDPYTNYISENDIEDYRTQNTGQYGGVGAVTTKVGGKTIVTMVLQGYSAHKKGLQIGDEVIKINGIDITKISSEAADQVMRGQAKSAVSLTVKRFGLNEPLDIKMIREKITLKNIPYYGMVADDIGYIKLSEFRMEAGKDVKESLLKLKSEGAKKVIFDLRGNPGGLLIEAVKIVNLFLPIGKDAVSTKGKVDEHNRVYKTLDSPVDTDIPLAILINSGSASASEIVAGVIQDYDRGIIVGQKSFGKGLVQVTRPLSYNAQLKVTTAKYYTPSGRCIQALDYSHRNPDGSVGKTPDSLKTAYKTTNGRVVFDGGGIKPDVNVATAEASPILRALHVERLLFDYATLYRHGHDSIVNARDFKLSDKEYQDFVDWLSTKDYDYITGAEKSIEKLVLEAKNEKYYERISEQIDNVRTKLHKHKSTDILLKKDEIKRQLELDIVSRYYFEKGLVESSFNNDKDLAEAIQVLNDEGTYKELLGY